MSDNGIKMTCAEFQAQLPELIGSGADASQHPHIQSCELCRALLADLETIAEAARQLLPVEEPPDDLWAQIESKIKGEESGDKGSGGGGNGDEAGGKKAAFEPA
jgi:hypothetical protein